MSESGPATGVTSDVTKDVDGTKIDDWEFRAYALFVDMRTTESQAALKSLMATETRMQKATAVTDISQIRGVLPTFLIGTPLLRLNSMNLILIGENVLDFFARFHTNVLVNIYTGRSMGRGSRLKLSTMRGTPQYIQATDMSRSAELFAAGVITGEGAIDGPSKFDKSSIETAQERSDARKRRLDAFVRDKLTREEYSTVIHSSGT